MPLDTLQALLSSANFEAMGTRNTVVVAEPAALPQALALVSARVREIDTTCSRFRADSELSRLNGSAGGGPVQVSRVLEEALVASMDAARMTDGLVDPTIGRCLEAIGYTVTLGEVPPDGPALELCVRGVAGWRAVEIDVEAATVRLPAGVALDLGASGKAWAADAAATEVSRCLGVGVLVECGGDVAVSGPPPAGGWPVRVASGVGAADGQDVRLCEGGLATSGVTARRWRRGGVAVHDIIDPRTGLPATTRWEMVTVAAATCLEANAAATAAIIIGEGAPAWLEALGLPSRLVHQDGTVFATGGWAA
jgi:thiamine biosynthesis lipoprotein